MPHFKFSITGYYLLFLLEEDFDDEPDELDFELEEELLTLDPDLPLLDDELPRDTVALLPEDAELLEGALIVRPELALLRETVPVFFTGAEVVLLVTWVHVGALLTALLRVLVV